MKILTKHYVVNTEIKPQLKKVDFNRRSNRKSLMIDGLKYMKL
jgi:hypothetical protein